MSIVHDSPGGETAIRISAVVPTYNRASTLGRALDSILSQSRPPDEVVVVDDGSTDGTERIVASFGNSIRYVAQDNAGVGAARLRGLEIALHEWVAFLDSDDRWTPRHLDRTALAIRQTRGRALVYFSDVHFLRDDGSQSHWAQCRFDPAERVTFFPDGTEIALMRTQPVILPGSVINRKAALSVGGAMSSLRTREDTLLIFLLALSRPVCAVRQIAALITCDANARLTVAHGPASGVYIESSIALYRTLLGGFVPHQPPVYEVLRTRLQAAYISAIFYRLRRFEPRKGWAVGLEAYRDCGPQLGTAMGVRVARALWRRLGVGVP